MLWPAVRVSGRVRPLALKPAPETFTCEIVTLELPLLVKTTVCALELPTATFPKLKLVGLAESKNVGTKPVPLRAIVTGEFVALLATDTLPVTLPADAGAKATFRVTD